MTTKTTELTHREQVLLGLAEQYAMFPSEAKVLPTMLDVMVKKLSMPESEVLWHLSTNDELAKYAVSVARDVALTSE